MFENETVPPLTSAAQFTPPYRSEEQPTSKAESRIVIAVVTAGACLGILGDLLLRTSPGINVALCVTAVIAAAFLVGRTTNTYLPRSAWVFMAAALMAALGIAWRDSPTLRGLNGSVCLFMLALAAVPSDRIASLGFTDYISRFFAGVGAALSGAFVAKRAEILWFRIPRLVAWHNAWAVLRGFLLLLPFLFLFGYLFARADAEFERIARYLTDWDMTGVIIHGFWIFAFTWIATGFLHRQVDRPENPNGSLVTASRPFTIGAIEATVVLSGLNLLFFAFILIQFKYLFGGQAHVSAAAGLTMAEYARRGFFELAVVAALVLPLLWAGNWFVHRADIRADRQFRILAGVMIGMVFCIIAGAMYRMGLYMRSYGLTELRLYTSAFMFMLAAIFAWFGATVLRRYPERFTTGAVAIGFLALIVVQAVNPDARIVQANLARTEPHRSADIDYLAKLSLDAVPVLTKVPKSISSEDLNRLRTVFAGKARTAAADDWRSWSWAKQQAWNALQ